MNHPTQDALVDVALALGHEARARVAHVHACPECLEQIDTFALIGGTLAATAQPDAAVLARISATLRAARTREHERARAWELAAKWANGLLASCTALAVAASAGIDLGANFVAAAAAAVVIGSVVAWQGVPGPASQRHPA